jgi:MFS family permease
MAQQRTDSTGSGMDTGRGSQGSGMDMGRAYPHSHDEDTDSNLGGETGRRIAASEWADLLPSAGARELGHGFSGGNAHANHLGPRAITASGSASGGSARGGARRPGHAEGTTGSNELDSFLFHTPPRCGAAGGASGGERSEVRSGGGGGQSGLGSARELLSNPVFLCCLLGLSALFFVVNGIQFWATQYLLEVLHADPFTALSTYAATSATAPVLGVLAGGAAVDRLAANQLKRIESRTPSKGSKGSKGAGGKGSAEPQPPPPPLRRSLASEQAARTASQAAVRRVRVLASMRVAVAFAACACLAAPCACVFISLRIVVLCLWLVLFCGGATLAPVTGAMLACSPRQLRPLASALSTLTSNLLGYALSSFLSGCVMAMVRADRTRQLRVGFTLVLGWSAVALVCFACGLVAAQHEPGAAVALSRLLAERRSEKPLKRSCWSAI